MTNTAQNGEKSVELSKDVYFHVGLAKTGTKFLQYHFFPKLKDVKYIQRTQYRDFRYLKVINRTDHKRYLISNEFDRQFKQEIDNIASVCHHAKIIVVLRRHDSWIASQYRRQIKNGHSFSFKEFIDLENDEGFWKKDVLKFYPLLQHVEKKLKHKPCVLLFQDFREDPYSFLDSIARYVGATYDKKAVRLARRHSSYNDKQLKAIRKISAFLFPKKKGYSKHYWMRKVQRILRMLPRYIILYAALLVPEFLVGKSPLIPEEDLDRVHKHYEEDWKRCLDYVKRS